MKERVGDEKLIIISVAVRGINDHIRFTMILGQDDPVRSPPIFSPRISAIPMTWSKWDSG